MRCKNVFLTRTYADHRGKNARDATNSRECERLVDFIRMKSDSKTRTREMCDERIVNARQRVLNKRDDNCPGVDSNR
jgi:hypothetical protein